MNGALLNLCRPNVPFLCPLNFAMDFFNELGIFVKTNHKSNSLETADMSFESCRTVFLSTSFLRNYYPQPFCKKWKWNNSFGKIKIREKMTKPSCYIFSKDRGVLLCLMGVRFLQRVAIVSTEARLFIPKKCLRSFNSTGISYA